MTENIKAVTETSSNFGRGEQSQITAKDRSMINKSTFNDNTSINQSDKKIENSNRKENPFRKLFKKIHSPTEEIVEATGISSSDKLISRSQFIVMSGHSPSSFHAVLQKLPNFPKVRETRRRQNFYSVTEVNDFLASIN